MSNLLELPPLRTTHRPDVVEGRVSSEDRTLSVLLGEAFRIKEEVCCSLQRSEACAHSQAVSRTLLQSHILTITRIVQQLSVSVQTLQSQIAERDRVACGTTQAVQHLDHKNTSGISDLRGRVARCDGSLSRLSAEVTGLQQEVTRLRSAVDVMIQKAPVQQRDLGRLEASLAEMHRTQRSFMSEVQTQVGKVQNPLSPEIMEIVKQCKMLKKWTEQQIQHCLHSFEQSHRQLQDNMDGLLNRQSALDTVLKEQRSHQERCVGTQAARLRHMEAKLNNKMDSLEKSLHHELQLLKHNYHKGFRAVHDAIETLKEITDLKSRLDKGHIKKELEHIYRNVTCDS